VITQRCGVNGVTAALENFRLDPIPKYSGPNNTQQDDNKEA